MRHTYERSGVEQILVGLLPPAAEEPPALSFAAELAAEAEELAEEQEGAFYAHEEGQGILAALSAEVMAVMGESIGRGGDKGGAA